MKQNDIENIELSCSIETIIENFNIQYKSKYKKYLHYLENENQLDYLLMKRFLFTAYNNLIDIDGSIKNSRASKPFQDLNKLNNLYKEIELVIKKPINLHYQNIFLTEQKALIKYNEEIENNKKHLDMIKIQITQLKEEIDNKKLDQINNEKEIKDLNKKYVDQIHFSSELKNLNIIYQKMINEFNEKHEQEFCDKFILEINKINNDILNILNFIAYSFDSILWEEARKSESIQKFFTTSQIKGSFCSKTYLEYYLKTINIQNISEEQKKLFELLEYLKKNVSKHLFILGNDLNELQQDKFVLEGFDKDLLVTTAMSVEKIFIEYINKKIDFIIIDYELKQQNALDLIEEFWTKYPETKLKIPILIRFQKPNYKIITRAGKMGIRYMMKKPIELKELENKIKEVL